MEIKHKYNHDVLLWYAKAYTLIESLPIDDWLLNNLRLDATSPIQGPYDVANSPQLRGPLLAFQDDDVRMVTTLGPNQGGRTQAMLGATLWAIVNRPGPMQWNTSKDETAKELAEQKWWPTAKACPPVVAKMPAHGTGLGVDRFKERIRSVIFSDGMPFKIQGCSPANLEEKSIMTQFNDECFQWPVGRLEIAHIRCNVAYAWNYKIWNGSVAGVDGDDIDLLFRSGTAKEWHWRCDKCGEQHIPNWHNIKWEMDARTRPNDREWDYRELKKTVRYQCPACKAEYADNPRSRRLLNESAEYVALNLGAEYWHQSFRFNILSVNWPGITWGQWAEEFLKAVSQSKRYSNLEPLKKFWTRRMVEPWDESKHYSGTQKAVLSDYRLGDHDYSQNKWERETIRFMSVDKQEWGYPFTIRAVAANGDSRLVGLGVSEQTCLTSYDEIDVKAKEYGVASQCVLIDCGYETREVYAQAVKFGWTCMRGVDKPEPFRHYKEIVDPNTKMLRKVAIELPYSTEQWADPFSGTEHQQLNRRYRRLAAPRLARRYDWQNLHIKNLLSAFKQGRALYWGVPGDVDQSYLKQINSEVRHVVINARGQRTEWWSNTNAKGTGAKRANHAWDCECQIVVALCLQGLINLSDWTPE
jgi:hypothetical protein